jgi:hypothetical protein
MHSKHCSCFSCFFHLLSKRKSSKINKFHLITPLLSKCICVGVEKFDFKFDLN